MSHAIQQMVKHEGVGSLYKGLAPTLVGIAPYAALNFASYDLLKAFAYSDHKYVPCLQEPIISMSQLHVQPKAANQGAEKGLLLCAGLRTPSPTSSLEPLQARLPPLFATPSTLFAAGCR